MERAEELVRSYYIEPFRQKQYGYVGMEFEYPIISTGVEEISFKEIGSAFLKELTDKYGYEEEIIGTDGYYVRVSKGGDSVSFDYCYSLFELSMGKERTLWEIQERMFPILRAAQKYYAHYGCLITGMGLRPVQDHRAEYTSDPFYAMIRQFITDYGEDKDVGKSFPNMCSVQTHIDIPYGELLGTYNLFNRMDFVRGLLFSNSYGQGPVYCMRDFLWDNSGIPNTGIYDMSFPTLDALGAAISQEKIFVKEENGKLHGMKPQSLLSYFEDGTADGEDIRFFRSFKRVVLNAYHVLEVRGDCVQPVKDSFVTAAFHLGIAYNYRKAEEALEQFLSAHQIQASNGVLRRMAITGQKIAEKEGLQAFLNRLLDLAEEGLGLRGCKEEEMLLPLRERVSKGTNPAMEMEQSLGKGKTIWDLARAYGGYL